MKKPCPHCKTGTVHWDDVLEQVVCWQCNRPPWRPPAQRFPEMERLRNREGHWHRN